MKTRLPDDAPVKAHLDLLHDCQDGMRRDLDTLSKRFEDQIPITTAFRANSVISFAEIKEAAESAAAAALANHDQLTELKGSIRTIIDMQGAVGSRIGVERPGMQRQPLEFKVLVATMTGVSGVVFAVLATLWKAHALFPAFMNLVTAS